MTGSTSPVGLLIGSHIPPADIPRLARVAEDGRFGELWITEDLWYTSGIVGAGAALAATERIPVGMGIISAVTRHVSIQALDFATLCHIYPGRFWPGIGLGLPAWLDQMNLRPRSLLRGVGDTVATVRDLLGGTTVSRSDTHHLDGITLAYPLDPVPPIYIGAVQEKAVRQAGRLAEGLVVSALSSPAYVRWARELVDEGAREAGATERRRIVTFAVFCGDEDPAAAANAVRSTLAFYLSVIGDTALVSVYGITDELAELATGGVERIAAEMPDQWVQDFAVTGDAEGCAAKIQSLLDAGSDSVILFPAPFERGEELVNFAAAEVLPRLGVPA
ncbi:MAG: LLM class flavin-dependent oxidoreductase [Solirubrobacterales bacterium]